MPSEPCGYCSHLLSLFLVGFGPLFRFIVAVCAVTLPAVAAPPPLRCRFSVCSCLLEKKSMEAAVCVLRMSVRPFRFWRFGALSVCVWFPVLLSSVESAGSQSGGEVSR